jgi:dipeptidyl aminopeptidase/acylaminoacyl peptidase
MPRLMFPVLLFLLAGSAPAGETYKKPPKEILEVLDAPATPLAGVSPSRDAMLLAEPLRYPSIADLAQPMLRLAGLRINPITNGPHQPFLLVSLAVQKIAGGPAINVTLPPGTKPGMPEFSPDGKQFAFTSSASGGAELWVCDTATAKARRLGTLRLNTAYGEALQWMPDSRTLLVRLIPATRGKAPPEPRAPSGPNVQESYGRGAPTQTFEDLLKNPHDEDLFDHYTQAQLAFVDSASGRAIPVGKPGVYEIAAPAPDGQHLLVARIHRPYSYLYPSENFPKEVEVWDRAGKVVHKLASLPLADAVPMDGVPTGPREYEWRPNEPATLVWAEALDNGDPKRMSPYRDRLLMLKSPFSGAPAEILKTEQRFMNVRWGEKGGLALATDYERERRWLRTVEIDADRPSEPARIIWDRGLRDRYKDPGTPLMRTLATGHRVLLQDGDSIFLAGQGASPEGDRPFLDRLNLKTQASQRLFRSGATEYESVVAVVDPAGVKAVTRRESPSEPPNYFLRTLGEHGAAQAMTKFPDPTPQLRGIKKQIVKYKRADGVDLSFTLYLPPDYKEGTRLPTVVWAYPLEYNDPATAGQVSGSAQRFTRITGISHLFFLLRGYAVLDGAALPVVGDFKTVNNTYIEQIVAGAKAAIDKAAEMGVTDPQRVGVGGHSYGAFMTANLLAHCDLFRAGIARSGAYNRTLTPFGFQSERRTLWEASETYLKMSPFMFADKIKAPILLIHGEADDNSGTFPIQSDRMYQALRGTGGKVRLVMLPFEAHGYAARESVEHTLYEMMAWFDRYVKEAPAQ